MASVPKEGVGRVSDGIDPITGMCGHQTVKEKAHRKEIRRARQGVMRGQNLQGKEGDFRYQLQMGAGEVAGGDGELVVERLRGIVATPGVYSLGRKVMSEGDGGERWHAARPIRER